jgi:hypothetical protein
MRILTPSEELLKRREQERDSLQETKERILAEEKAKREIPKVELQIKALRREIERMKEKATETPEKS